MLYTGRGPNIVMHALALLVIFISLVLPAYCSSNSSDHEFFLPINIREYEAAMGIQRRAQDGLVDMRPKPHVDLIYGRPGKNQHMLLAHMKLHASNGMEIVLMERFEHLTKSVDCHGQDGILSLTFKSKAAFNRALEAWSFINDAEEVKFLLITNHEDCSPSDQRRPYIVTNIRDDPATLTTFLTALEAPWAKVAETFDLDFGKAVLRSRPVSRRFLDRVDQDIDSSVDISAGQEGKTFTILPGGRSKNDRVDCVDCFVRGSIRIWGHVKANSLIVEVLHLEVEPRDLAAAMSLEVTIEKQEKVDTLSLEETIADVPIPAAGVAIKDVFSLGLHVQFAAGFATRLKSGITFRAGLKATLPGTAKMTLDAVQFWESSATGFDGFTVDPIAEIKSLSKTVDISLAAKPKLIFGVDIMDTAKFEISAILNLPEVKGTCTAKFKPGGLCPNDPTALKTGVELAAKVDVELDLQIDRGLGGKKGDPLWQQKLWSAEANFLKLCFPLDIPSIYPHHGKLVASADSSSDAEDSDNGSDSDTGANSDTEADSDSGSDSDTEADSDTGADSNIFATENDNTNAVATNSDSSDTGFFHSVFHSMFDSEEDSTPSETEESKSGTEERSSEEDPTSPDSSFTPTTDPSSAYDFSNDFESTTNSDFSPLPEFTTAPETSPAPQPVLALAGSESLPELTPPADASLPDSQLGLDSYLSSDPSIPSAQPDLFSDADTSSPRDGSTSLPERNSVPEGELQTLGEGSNFESAGWVPSEAIASSDQNSLSTPDESNLVQDRSSLPFDDVYTLPEDGSSSSTEALELGEGSNFIRTESAEPVNLFLDRGLGTEGDGGTGVSVV